MGHFLQEALIYLAAAVIAVPISKRFGLGSVLGYLAAGAVIGPSGIKLINDPESVLHFAEFGVVLFLFLVGLELQPRRLWDLRRSVFGLGGAQVIGTGLLLGLVALGLLMVSDIPYRSSKDAAVRPSNRATVITAIAFVCVLAKPSVTLFLIGLAYVAHGPIEIWWRRRHGIVLEEVEPAAAGGEA